MTMKNFRIFAIGAALTMGLASCGDSYFDVDLEQNIKTDAAYSTPQDVQNGMIGAFIHSVPISSTDVMW